MNKLTQFVRDSYTEMMEHVTWLTYKELQSSSVLVLVASIIFALVIGLMDFTFKELLQAIYQAN